MREDCHGSEKLDTYLGKAVEITYKDGTKEIGILTVPGFGIGYMLKCRDHNTRFFKSHVKKIREV